MREVEASVADEFVVECPCRGRDAREPDGAAPFCDACGGSGELVVWVEGETVVAV